MKKNIHIFLFCLTLLYTAACSKKKDACDECPVVRSLTPDLGFAGDTIILVGKNFSTDLQQNAVTFNGTTVPTSDLISCNGIQLKVLVPYNCGTGPVNVSIGENLNSAEGPTFTYEPAHITSFSPAEGKKNDTILIRGEHFSTTKNSVKFNGLTASVFYESDTLIKAIVPVNCGTGIITITLPNALVVKSLTDFKYIYTYTTSTYIGIPKTEGAQNGPFLTATFKDLHAFVYDYRSRSIYISDGNCIRRCNNGEVTTWAGNQTTSGYKDGYGNLTALFNNPGKLAASSIGDLYVPDLNNYCIRKITAANALVSTFCGKGTQMGDKDGRGAAALFGLPYAVDIIPDSVLYISDFGNKKLRKVDSRTSTGNVTTVPLTSPLTCNEVFILNKTTLIGLDISNNQLMKIDLSTNTIAPFAGTGAAGALDGDALSATFNSPTGAAMRTINGKREIYIADTQNNAIRKITEDGKVTTVLGGTAGYAEGVNLAALFDHPNSLVFDGVYNTILYVLDAGNKIIRKVVID